MNKRAAIHTVFFLSIIAVCCLSVQRPYHDMDIMFIRFFSVSAASNKAQIKTYLAATDLQRFRPGQMEKTTPYYERMLLADSATHAIITSLDSQEHKKTSADSMFQHIHDWTNFQLSQLPADSAMMGPFCRVTDVFYTRYPFQAQWLQHVMDQPSSTLKSSLLAMLRAEIYEVERIMIKQLREISSFRCCFCFDSMGMVAVLADQYPVSNQSVTASLFMGELKTRDWVEYSVQDSLLRQHGNLARLTIAAGAPGDHILSGTARWYTDKITDTPAYYTVPWQLRYRVLGKGASLLSGNDQVCYRDVDNPVSVYIPGYPPDRVSLHAPGASVKRVKGGQFTIHIADTSLKTITVFADATDVYGHTATVHSATFRTGDLPHPTMTLDNTATNALPASSLTQTHQLSAMQPDDWPVRYTIISYEVCIIDASGKYISTDTVHGNQLNTQELASLSPGAKLYFMNIKATTQDGTLVSVSPAAIVIE